MDNVENVIILGAAGRDFHDFMVYWSVKPNTVVKCFTGTQIPGIDHRRFPPEMCNNDKNGNLYPSGIMIYPESELEKLIRQFNATTCALAYSDLNYDTVQSLSARVNAQGCKFVQLPPKLTQLKSTKPVLAICATRTGTGKSQTTRLIASYLKNMGKKVAVVRHPMPYDPELLNQRCQRYETKEDMDKYDCTIEEREEYELHIEEGNLLFAGVDYEMILRQAEKDSDVVLWDGGNNDFSFYQPDVNICVADALRAAHEQHYYPGEINARMADLILINKTNSLSNISEAFQQAEKLKAIVQTDCPIIFGKSVVSGEAENLAAGKLASKEEITAMVRNNRVLVIDDGPTLTHGGMPYGAGYVLARELGAGEIVSARHHAKGSLVGVFEKYPHLSLALPAMGYGPEQTRDLEATIHDAKCDCIVVGTPINLGKVLKVDKPWVRARYCLEVLPEHSEDFFRIIGSVFERFAKQNQSHPQ